ncbi:MULTISPECIES: DEAD/DEAH box helicase [unclassified Nocardioides]|uniref:DEAD/DEAH box helicase n=1 Tax=unclassified Nocardioides TaxID=2615069 RepID=UPI0006FE2B79|nr:MULTISPECIES: DEAD/DEAH box helicase [unclassified Nocardioides]KRA27254.1 DEAD/DEAH box helicase [Nocardioides sp. Root614]KRA91130.1 DEAD/DEAH box helicase [Nocardioides sp. Root682]
MADSPGSSGSSGNTDAAYDRILAYAEGQGLTLYPHQEEALLSLLSGENVILATPTGSGKSLVAMGAAMAALADDRVTFYTAPIKALVSEKFFDLVEIFGAADVGMLTGDVSVNADAPIICCTAEVLANIALREGEAADVGMVVMDEFHFYGEPGRGWAWQVPLIELPRAQFLLMSATLGDVTELAADMTRRNGRDTAVVDEAERPVPLNFSWSLDPMGETLEELVTTGQGPVYVVHFTQAAAVEHAVSLLAGPGRLDTVLPKDRKEQIAERIAGVRFAAGFGKILNKLLRQGIGVHHAGMLPRYRRLVEQLAQAGLLTVICGTDTLGVGINVPIRTVLFTGLAKFDGTRQRVLRTREFLQIAGRAGRAGFDTAGYVVVQAPEHVIENEKAKAKAAAKNAAMSVEKQAKRKSKAQLRKPPEGTVVWSEQTFTRLVEGKPEPLKSQMKVDNGMLVNVLSRDEDAFVVLRRLLMDNHEERRTQLRLAKRAVRLARSLVTSEVLTRLDEIDGFGRRYVLTEALPEDFALNQPLSHFALAVLDVLDPESPDFMLDVISVMEATLEAPRPLLFAQRHAARGDAIAALKADGVEYDERMVLVEQITWPEPLGELLEPLFETYRERHPWLPPDALAPKSVVREMWEQGMGFTDLVSRYQIARSEGLILRYLTDAYRALRHSVPDAVRTDEFELLVEWLGETVRQVDSSLLDEWEALNHPDHIPSTVAHGEPPPPPRPLSQQGRVFEVMVRNAMWRRVELFARDDVPGLAALEAASGSEFGEKAWDEAIEDYFAEHRRLLTDGDARGPALLSVDKQPGRWVATQTLHDPEGNHDWVIVAEVDLSASDEAGEAVVRTLEAHCLTG